MTGAVIWLTGLPSSGKSTFARRLAAQLRIVGRPAIVLDSDELRSMFGHQEYVGEQREAFYFGIGKLAANLAAQDFVVIVAATAHRRLFRERAREAVKRFIEVYLETPLVECELRDAKGLYAQARAGQIRDMPGFDADYEPPLAPEVIAAGGLDDAAIDRVIQELDVVARKAGK